MLGCNLAGLSLFITKGHKIMNNNDETTQNQKIDKEFYKVIENVLYSVIKNFLSHTTEFSSIKLEILYEQILNEIKENPQDLNAKEISKIINAVKEITIYPPLFEEKELTPAKPDDKENLPAVRSLHAKKNISSRDRFTRAIFGLIDNVDLEYLTNPELVKIKTDDKGKIFISANVRFEDLPEKMQTRLADRFTRAVCDSITSLILANNAYITPEHIAFALGGYSNKRGTFTPDFIEQIKEAVEVLRHTWCKIDASEEAKAKGYNFKETQFDGILAPIDALEVVLMNGKRVKAYRVLREPILYSYAKQKNQVLTVDIDMLALPEHVNMTRENIILQRYLFEEIEKMKNTKTKRSCVLLYESIYKVLEAQEATRDDKKRIRNTVKKFLDNWVDLKYIKGYEEESEGRLIRDIFIKLFEDEPKKLRS